MLEEKQLKSKLPVIDTQVKIITVSTSLMKRTQQYVKIKRVHVPEKDEGDSPEQVFDAKEVTLYEIVNPIVQGYLPSKVWWEFERGYVLMYYINDNITAKPFQGQRVFCFAMPEERDWVLSYDVRATLFIDQIRVQSAQLGSEMYYFFIFGENDYHMVVDGFLPFGILPPKDKPTTEQPKTPGTTRSEKETDILREFYKGETKDGQ